MTVMLTFLSLLAAIATAVWVYISRFRGLPPGPWGLPLLGYLPWLAGRHPHHKLTQLAQRYGPIYSLRMGNVFSVVLSDPKLIRQAFASDDYAARAPLYLTHGIMKGNGIICVEGEKWKETRKFAMGALRSLGLAKFGPRREKLEADMLESIEAVVEELAALKTATDPEPILIHQMGNILFRLIFGHTWQKDDPTWKILQRLQEEGTKLIGIAGPINFLPFLRHLPRYRKAIEFVENGIQFTHQVYQDFLSRCEKTENPAHLMGAYLIEMERQGNGRFFDRTQFNYLMADIFGAGVDTTLATLRWFLLYIALNPEWQIRLQEDLDAITCDGRVDLKTNSAILEACILETQRVRSVTPVGIPHGTTKETQLSGYKIPAGTMVIPLQWAVHMNATVYQHPESFDPSRFLSQNGAIQKPQHFIPFQTGKRMCIGEDFAKNLLHLFAGNILARFQISLAEDAAIDLDGEPGITLSPHPYQLTFKPRH